MQYASMKNSYQQNIKEMRANPQARKHEREEKLRNLHGFLLKLNILKDIVESEEHNMLADALETDQLPGIVQVKRKSEIIEAVPLHFSSTQHYSKIWEPLFFDEAKAQLFKQRKENARMLVRADIIETNPGSTEDEKIVSFQNIQGTNTESFMPGSLVIISPVQVPIFQTQPRGQKDYPHFMGILQKEGLESMRVNFSQKEIKEKHPEEWELISHTKMWYIQLVGSIHTLEREYQALVSFETVLSQQLRETILHPHSEQNNENKFRIPQGLEHQLKAHFNQSQYKAISECLKQSGITLIQGPPGTGKTKTVLGTLSVLLGSFCRHCEEEEAPLMLRWKRSGEVDQKADSRLNPWLCGGFVDWRDEALVDWEEDPLNLTRFYEKCEKTDNRVQLFRKDAEIVLPGKVLICGPSNASVDEIIRKLTAENLLDGEGKRYLPNFIRVGEHYEADIREHSLDYVASKICKDNPREEYKRILSEYRLVFATLSAAGSQVIQNSGVKFDTVVIDEAGQCSEISNLIPLMYGCQRLILIGDPNQLPATIFSQKSLQHNYDQSLFERLMKSGYPVNILRTQYRMHPEISSVVSANFYGGQLHDSQALDLSLMPAYGLPHSFIIFHLDQSSESTNKKSFRNESEAKAILDFLPHFSKSCQDVGIISPYSQQVALIQSMVGAAKHPKVEVKTIDSYQGREKEVIIFSAVRARFCNRNKRREENRRKTIGFVGDARRINVSLSRAKSVCVIFADAIRLYSNQNWKNIIDEALHRGQVYKYQMHKTFHSQFKSNPDAFLIKDLVKMDH